MPRVRFTVRGLMVAVGVAGLVLGFERLLFDLANSTVGVFGPSGGSPAGHSRRWLVALSWMAFNLPFVPTAIALWISRRRAAIRVRERIARQARRAAEPDPPGPGQDIGSPRT